MTAKGREMIVKEYVDKITLYDPSPDDPDKFRIKLVFRPDKDSKLATEIESEVNLGVRQQLVEGHQTSGIRTYPTTMDWFGYLSFYGKINALRLSDRLLKMKWFVLQNKMNIIAPMLSQQRGDYL